MVLHLFSQTIPNITTRVSIECPRKPPFAPKVNIIWSATECLPSTNQLLLHGSAEEHILRRFSFSVAGNCIIALHQLIDVTAVGGLQADFGGGQNKQVPTKREAMLLHTKRHQWIRGDSRCSLLSGQVVEYPQ